MVLQLTSTKQSNASPLSPYSVNDAIDITVHFDKQVIVADDTAGAVAPRIHLDTGVTTRYALYMSGSGTTQLTFSYQVATGDTANPLKAIALEVWANGVNGWIKRVSTIPTTDAILTLPTPPGALSTLEGNKQLVIDTTVPYVLSVTIPAKVSLVLNVVTTSLFVTSLLIIMCVFYYDTVSLVSMHVFNACCVSFTVHSCQEYMWCR